MNRSTSKLALVKFSNNSVSPFCNADIINLSAQGSMRCDVNVSVHEVGKPYGARCELKNLNSIKSVMDAIGKQYLRERAQEIVSACPLTA